MALNLREAFTPAVMAANWTEVQSNYIDYLGTGLFPARKKAGLDLAWIRGSKGLPVSLMPSTLDAKATFRDRVGFSKVVTEMPFFREGFTIKEKDRQELLRVMDSNDPYAQEAIARIFDDNAELLAGAAVVAERMRMQLLFPIDGNAGISIKANGVDYTYNYDADGSWKTTNYIALTGGDLWSNPTTSDPFKVFRQAKSAIASNTGTILTTAIMNGNTFNMMAASNAIKTRYLTTSGLSMGYLTDTEVASVIKATNGLDIVVYNKQYKDENKASHSFIPDGYVALVPAGSIGSTWYGTTPEEADLMGGGNVADVAIVDTGVAITRVVNPHPVNISIFASEIVLPSYERMNEVAVIKVASGS